jgi:hypothetical protein
MIMNPNGNQKGISRSPNLKSVNVKKRKKNKENKRKKKHYKGED